MFKLKAFYNERLDAMDTLNITFVIKLTLMLFKTCLAFIFPWNTN